MLKIRSCFLRPVISATFLGLGGVDQLGHRHPLQLGDVDVAVVGIVLGDRGADAADAFGGFVELFGEREWFFAIELGEELAIDVGVAVAIGRIAAMRRARAIGTPRIAVRLIRHELFAPGREGERRARGRRLR